MTVPNTQLIYEIPGKLTVRWHPEARAIIDTWTTYDISLDEFSTAVLVRGLAHSRMNDGRAWIVDSHRATGALSQEIQDFIRTDVLPTFSANGVKYFMTITAESAETRASVAQYSARIGPNGIKLLQGRTAEGAIDWLMKNG